MRLVIAAATALTLAQLGAPAQAFVLVTNDLGQPVFWPTRCVTYHTNPDTIDEVTPEQGMSLAATAFAAWNDNPCAYVEIEDGGATCFDEAGIADFPGPQNIVMWRDGAGAWPYTERVIALTGLIYDNVTAEIVDADIEVNGDMFEFDTNGSPQAYDLLQALTHEVGHGLGIDHSLDERATMFWLSAPGETAKRVLTADDEAALCASHPVASAPPDAVCGSGTAPATIDAPYCPVDDADPNCSGGTLPFAVSLPLALGFLYRRRRPHGA